MNYQNKTRKDLIKELLELQKEHNSLKTLYEKDITERKLAEEALTEPGIPDKELMDLSRDVIFSLTPQGLFGSMNQAFEKTTGWQTQEWIGKPFTDLLHPEDIPLAEERFSNMMKGRTVQAIELRIRKKSGDYGCTEVLASPRMKKGMITGLLGIGRDITGRKKVEEELKRSEMQYRSLAENSPDLIARFDRQYRHLYVNQVAAKAGRYSPCEYIGKTIAEVGVPEEEAGRWEKRIRTAFETGQVVDVEDTFETPDGFRYFNTKFVPEFDPDGSIQTVQSIARDITERKQSENKLRFQSEILQNMKEGIQLTRISDAVIVYTNTYFEFMFGYQKDELIGKHVSILNAHVDKKPEEVASEIMNCLKQDSVWSGEIQNIRKDGSTFWSYVNISTYNHYEHGAIWISIHEDITERKRLEEIMKQERQELKLIIDSSPIIIFYKDKEGKYILVNKTHAEAIKLPEEEFVGKTVFDLYSDKIAQSMTNDDQEVLKSGRPKLNIIEQYESASGIRWVQTDKIPICDQNGVPCGLIGFAQDITERKRAEEQVLLANERLQYLLSSTSAVIYSAKASGDFRTTFTSSNVDQMVGHDPEDFIRDSSFWYNHVHPEDRVIVSDGMKTLFEKGLHTYEYRYKCKDGRYIWVRDEMKLVRDHNNNLLEIIGFWTNITERKQANEEIRKSKKLLEDLHKHLNEIREDERALISREIHDQIGQSLTALKLDLNWMHKYIGTKPKAVAKLEGMVEMISNTIKDVQRISSDLRPGILDDLGLAAAIEWYSGEFEKRTGIRCNLKLDDSTFGDSQKNLIFFRVFQEALTNVIRHANASEVTIELHQTQKGMTLAVQDNGIGITREKVESAKSLGLIGMRERIRQFGGKVGISSKKGQGTKLTVFIPEKKISKS